MSVALKHQTIKPKAVQDKKSTLDQLLQQQSLWKGQQWSQQTKQGQSSGYAQLDNQLPSKGWPKSTLNEVLTRQSGQGELQLLMPALAKVSQQQRWIIFIAPPFMPYAPALEQYGVDSSKVLVIRSEHVKDSLWALEQALKSGHCSAVLAWVDKADNKATRRLQLAAEASDCLSFLFRPDNVAQESSHAGMRIRIEASSDPQQLNYDLLKRRGAWPLAQQSLKLQSPLAPLH
ncbi:translesion DNA synthesis-associated protein ImuA [Alginatibacterium sediminis]|uniref:Translesion DNA synthesis-associated protein ImuA n=1 Tax=Alginatibacterium sediminis TaxID=2164068 RepID=A0A420E768_9ALTE|nr:translesion DNA synthesis-associated protein ImuA [Alginatibacterium sediminis]RKF13768.1 translesion DNA synthesis-associated protein ImuA [Alginatibacterium sediminis]